MTSLKPFSLGALTLAVLFFLFRSFFCQYFCPPCQTVSPVIPNPTIEVNVPNANFGVTPHPVAGATSVKIDVFSATGTLATSVSPAIGNAQAIIVPTTTQRPLQLVFTYTSANNPQVAVDSILVDDRKNGGTPIVEVLVGGFTGTQHACPNITNSVTLSPLNPAVTGFTWVPGKQYKIKVINGATTEEFILKTELNGQTGCYKVVLWRQNEFSCLTLPNMANTGSTEVEVTTGTGSVKITGTDLCNSGTARNIFLSMSGPGMTITVLSD